MSRSLPHVFLWEFYGFRTYIQIFNSFELIFVIGIKQWSTFTLLRVAVQFSQHQFIKEIVFSPLYVLASIVNNQLIIYMWVYIWDLYSVPLIICLFLWQYHTVLITTSLLYSLKPENVIPLALFFFLQITLVICALSWCHTDFTIICFCSVKNAIGILIGITLNLQIASSCQL